MKTVHIITRMIVGGAQENTLHTVEGQHADYGDDVVLMTGPTLGPEGSLMHRAEQGGFAVEVVESLQRSINPWREWRAYRTIVKRLRALKPDIVHTHSSKAGILGRAAAAKLKIPVVHTVHGAAFHFGQNRLAYSAYRFAERWASKRCDHFITVCDAMADQYVAEGVAPREDFTTVYSGFDVEPFLNPTRSREDVRKELGFRETDIVVGKIGRLFHLKGHEFVIEAAKRIAVQNENIQFLFIGDGILRGEYEEQIKAAGLSGRFHFTGLVPPTQIPELIQAMDIAVHTSQWEGLARVLPQALIAGKPVISYDVDGAREVVLPGVTGYLLERDSVVELGDAILELANDAELRERLGSEGRLRFTDQFRHQTMTRRIREVYAKVLG